MRVRARSSGLLARGGVYKTIHEVQNVDPALRRTRPGAGAMPGAGPADVAMAPAVMGSLPAGVGTPRSGVGGRLGIGGPPGMGTRQRNG